MRARSRYWGWLLLAGIVGFAAGNYHATMNALDGEAQWFRGWCGQQVQKTDQHHLQEDRDTFGFTPEDLKAPLPSSKK